MNLHRAILTRAGILLLLAAGISGAGAPAWPGVSPRVTGYYTVRGVTDLGDELRVTLQFRLANWSDRDFSDAKFTLRSDRPWVRIRGNFPQLFLRPHREETFTGDFIVPHREYERWQEGIPPMLEMRLRDADGREIKQAIRLVSRPAPQER